MGGEPCAPALNRALAATSAATDTDIVDSVRYAAMVALVLLTSLVLVSSLGAQRIPPVEARATPLHWAAENGLLGIATRLIENGALVDAPDQFGRTPLHYAVRSSAMVELLLTAGADVNVTDMFARTPLHEALRYPASVRVLLEGGADITAEDFIGNTPLERTLRYGTGSRNLAVIELLLAAGAGAPRDR